MPYKHNQSRRHQVEKAHYKVTNWPEYNKALRQRGDITIWFTEEALAAWRPGQDPTLRWSFHRTRRPFVQPLAILSETIISRSLRNRAASPGRRSRATTCATMPSLRCNATSAFSVTP